MRSPSSVTITARASGRLGVWASGRLGVWASGRLVPASRRLGASKCLEVPMSRCLTSPCPGPGGGGAVRGGTPSPSIEQCHQDTAPRPSPTLHMHTARCDCTRHSCRRWSEATPVYRPSQVNTGQSVLPTQVNGRSWALAWSLVSGQVCIGHRSDH